ncbi:MAG: type IX secretion system protein PorG [Cecembia sp.]
MDKINYLIVCLWLFLLTVSLFPVTTKAQSYELGGGLGVATYTGDIVRRWDQGNVGIQGTLFGRRNFDNVWSLRGSLSFARLSAADSTAQIDLPSITRDAYFRGSLFELAAVMEYHFIDFLHPQSVYRYSPYGFFGVGYSLFTGSGQSYFADPEAGGYNVGTPVIPFGIGIKYQLSEKWMIAAELGFRATFTDLLDKIDGNLPINPVQIDPNGNPQPIRISRGNYSDKDWYYFLGLTISYSFNNIRCYTYN